MKQKKTKALRDHAVRRLCAVGLSLTTVLTALCTGISAFAVKESNTVYKTETALSEGLTYETLRAEENGVSQEGYLLTYTGGLSTLPVVTAGDGVWGRETASKMASSYMAGTDAAGIVSAGINADFFSMTTGIPMGIMIEGGEVLTTDAGENALGMKADGTVLIGTPSVTITLHKEAETETQATDTGLTTGTGTQNTAVDTSVVDVIDIRVNHLNKYPSVWGAYLITPDFDKTTHSAEAGTEYVFRFTENEPENAGAESSADTDTLADNHFAIGKTVNATLTEVRRDVKNGAVPEDGFVIVVHNNAQNAGDFSSLAVGDAVSITLTAAEGWEDVTFAVGGGDILVENGIAKSNGFSADHAGTANPRTAIGYTADGKIRIFAVDGRTGASKGMTLTELAQTMTNFGCVGALNLDGGGSTTVLVRERDGAYIVANNPTDGYERRISNAILFVNTAVSDSIPCYAEITPGAAIVYKDTAIDLSVAFFDKSYTPVTAEGAVVTWISDGGIVNKNGTLTPTLSDSGVTTVSAQVRIPVTKTADDGTATSGTETTQETVFTISTNVYQVDTLDGLSADVSSVTVPLGGISDPVTVMGIWNGRNVYIEKSYLRAVFVDMADGGAAAVVNPQNPDRGTYGYADSAFRIHCTASADDVTMFTSRGAFPVETVAFSVNDEGRTAVIYVPVTFGAAAEVVLDMEEKNLRDVLCVPETKSGTVSRLSAGGVSGTAAAVVNAQAVTVVTTPRAAHAVKRIDLWVKGTLPDGAYAEISYNGTVSTIAWTVTDDFTRLTGWKRISLDTTALDKNGIRDFEIKTLLASDSGEKFKLTVDDLLYHFGDDLVTFTDIGTSWAKESILTVARMGVVGGIPQNDGTYTFNPTGLLTRAEFAKMICVFAGLTVPEAPTAEELYPSSGTPDESADEAEETADESAADPVETTAETTASDTVSSAETDSPAETEPTAEPTAAVAVTPYLPFADLADIPEWALPYIKAVTEAGLMKGKTTGETDADGNPITRFAATDTMTRAEVMQVLGALLDTGTADAPATAFADDAKIPAWARANITACVNAGIVSGFDDNTIRPMATITRAEIATLLVRVNVVL